MWIKRYTPPRFALCRVKILRVKIKYALVAELADAYGSGPYFLTEVQVQFLSGAPSFNSLNLFTIGKMFGLFYVYKYLTINSLKYIIFKV